MANASGPITKPKRRLSSRISSPTSPKPAFGLPSGSGTSTSTSISIPSSSSSTSTFVPSHKESASHSHSASPRDAHRDRSQTFSQGFSPGSAPAAGSSSSSRLQYAMNGRTPSSDDVHQVGHERERDKRRATFGIGSASAGGSLGRNHHHAQGQGFRAFTDDDTDNERYTTEPASLTVDLATPRTTPPPIITSGLQNGQAIQAGTGERAWYAGMGIPAQGIGQAPGGGAYAGQGQGYAPVQVGKGKAKDGAMRLWGIELKWISLITLALQNAFLTIIMHYSRITASPGRSYSAASAVLLNELLKGSISLLIALRRVDASMTAAEGHNLSPTISGNREIKDDANANGTLHWVQEKDAAVSPIETKRGKTKGLSRGGRSAHSSRVPGGRAADLDSVVARVRHELIPFGKASRWQRLSKEVLSPDCWKLSIPAILYVIQNNLQYLAASNLDVATFQVTYQMKILTTAFFSVLLLRKRLSLGKWLALLLLAIGVGIVQIQSGSASPASSTGTAPVEAVQTAVAAATKAAGHAAHALRDAIPERPDIPDILEDLPAAAEEAVRAVAHEMHRLTGFAAVSAACMTSGLAGVYFEMVLKGSQADLWVRNAQLSLFSLVPALLPVLLQSGGPGGAGGLLGLLFDPFRNFGLLAWGTVLTQVFGGLVTALVIKYSDNILKGFATSLSIVISFLASVGLFAYPITPAFVLGSTIVLLATWMYNQPADAGRRSSTAATSSSGLGISADGSRRDMAVPGSPIPADAPIIGETPKPSRASSFVSLLGLNNSSRNASRAPTPINGMTPNHSPHPPAPSAMNTGDYMIAQHSGTTYRNGQTLNGHTGAALSAPTTPLLNGSFPSSITSPSSQSLHEQPYSYGRYANGHSPGSTSGVSVSQSRAPMNRRLSGRLSNRDRPKLEVDTTGR